MAFVISVFWFLYFRNIYKFAHPLKIAQMAKLVDALVSGTSGRKAVQVRVLFWALW
jgi:hypothetical protein